MVFRMVAAETPSRYLFAIVRDPAGSAVWCILGTGQTVKEWAAACQFGQARGSLDQKVAKGIFVAALGVLAAHYGKSRGRKRK